MNEELIDIELLEAKEYQPVIVPDNKGFVQRTANTKKAQAYYQFRLEGLTAFKGGMKVLGRKDRVSPTICSFDWDPDYSDLEDAIAETLKVDTLEDAKVSRDTKMDVIMVGSFYRVHLPHELDGKAWDKVLFFLREGDVQSLSDVHTALAYKIRGMLDAKAVFEADDSAIADYANQYLKDKHAI